MKKTSLFKALSFGLLVWTVNGQARATEPVVPGAGTLLQEVTPPINQRPSEQTGLHAQPEANTISSSSTQSIAVKRIELSGNTLFSTETLHALVAGAEGKTLTLAELKQYAKQIDVWYATHDYPYTRTIIPAQTLRDGTLTLQIVEARYSSTMVDNHSLVKTPLLLDTLSPLKPGEAISQAKLDHILLLMSDIPGLAIDATLSPGNTTGTSTLEVQANPTPAYNGYVQLDNYGNRYTGDVRLGANANFINLLHHGDILNVYTLSSGYDMGYGRASYETLLDGTGTRMGASYSVMRYILGDPLNALNAHGTADIASIWGKHPLIRSKTLNLYAQVQYDHEQLNDDIDAQNLQTSRHLDNWTLSLSGDLRDTLWTGGVNTWSVAGRSGRVTFDNAVAQASDAASADTQGGFTKWNATFARIQNISASNSLYLSISGQLADKNLDPSEMMLAGGPYSVRAYQMGVLSGDEGMLFSAEWRHWLTEFAQGQVQLVGFFDDEHILINRNIWVAGQNSATLSGVGAGVDWTNQDAWTVRGYVATPTGSTPALLSDRKSLVGWLLVSKGF